MPQGRVDEGVERRGVLISSIVTLKDGSHETLPTWLIVVGMSFPISAWAAENRIINMVDCKLDAGMTIEDVQEVNGRWVRYVNKNVPGGDIRSFVVRDCRRL